jgi:hypothetical protein
LPSVNSTSRALAAVVAGALIRAAEEARRDFTVDEVRGALAIVLVGLGGADDEHDQPDTKEKP